MADDVELCLEVQVDPASKKILQNPEKCRSALLDVTVVKPKELEAFGTHKTNTLRADEVRKLITSLEKQRRKKQKVLDKLKYDDTIIRIRKHENYCDCRHCSKTCRHRGGRISSSSPVDDLERKDFIGIAESVEPLFCEIKRSLKNVETRITNMQDINLAISHTTVDETASEEYIYPKRKNRSPLTSSNGIRNQSVYRVETAPHSLKSVLFSDKQKVEDKSKIQGKCLCENCGIVGLLTECQKHPLLADFSDSPPQSEHRKLFEMKKKTRFNILKSMDNPKLQNAGDVYVCQLNDRVKLLEQRLAMQEERVVPKDYFKKIITKMVTNFSPKLFRSKSDTSLHCPDKSKKNVRSVKSSRHHSPLSDKSYQSGHGLKNRSTSAKNQKTKEQQTTTKNDKSTLTEDDIYYSGYVWKWGEEILKPGIDLKNKIVTLLNEILGKLSLNEVKSRDTTKFVEPQKIDDYNSETIRRFMKHMSTKVYNAQVDTKPKFTSNEYAKHEKLYNFESFHHSSAVSEYSKKSRASSPHRNQLKKPSEKYNKKIDVSYINPKLSLWRAESPDNKTEDKLPEQKNNTFGKQEFLKIVSKAKQHQKDILWKNIWNQAKANGQTKKDVITIKIPGQMGDSKGKPKMFETEISIGEVEQILKSN